MPFARFNQDSSALNFCGDHNYELYSLTLSNPDKVEIVHRSSCTQRYMLVERLKNTSLIAVVTETEPCTLKLCHFRKDYVIVTETMKDEILSVKLNCQVLALSTAAEIVIFDVRTMKLSHRMDVSGNPLGLLTLACLSMDEEASDISLVAYPTCKSTGDLRIFNCYSKSGELLIKAHLGPLAAVSFSHDATFVATASVKGTVIRVFAVKDGSKLYEFRRGLSRSVRVSSLAFDSNRQYLVASSDTETVHIFAMTDTNRTTTDKLKGEESWTGYVTSAIKSSILPTSLINPDRAFAIAKLSGSFITTTASIVSVNNTPYILVVALSDDDARLHVFEMDSNRGGNCDLTSIVVLGSESNNSNNNNNISSENSGVVYPVSRLKSKPIQDASYAYKLKTSHRKATDSSGQLTEIVENAGEPLHTREESFDLDVHQPNLRDKKEFPPISGVSSNQTKES